MHINVCVCVCGIQKIWNGVSSFSFQTEVEQALESQHAHTIVSEHKDIFYEGILEFLSKRSWKCFGIEAL